MSNFCSRIAGQVLCTSYVKVGEIMIFFQLCNLFFLVNIRKIYLKEEFIVKKYVY